MAPMGQGAERRAGIRIPVEMWVEETSERELYLERSANLSLGGIYLENAIPRALGSVIKLQFTLPGDSQPIQVRGEIVNVGETAKFGMGIRFVDLPDAEQKRLAAFIDERERRQAGEGKNG